uniref:SCP domain-containing protein n=1 Tax=Escherichia phage ETEP102 TaxID=3117680 RepID=A0AAU6PXU9_9CAUD
MHEACEQLLKDLPKYNGDPCHSTVDAFVSEMAKAPDDGVKCYYLVADELTKNGKFTFGSNFGEGKALTMSTAKMEPRIGGYGYGNRHVWAVGECESARDRKVAVCYHVNNGSAFINGCEYAYEIDECEPGCEPRLIHIAQDAFISDLKGDYRWKAKRIGKVMNAKATLGDAYAIVNPDCGVVAKFYIK